ncbi:MAG: gliding motility-associated C-terminal domain-containing protein, partial [Saprospiraceae bacterium]|nr:gliding motility-associated C-terminal domain-containing protein [Saprospiraceae bacterium]
LAPQGLQQQYADTWQWRFVNTDSVLSNEQSPLGICPSSAGDYLLQQLIQHSGCLDSFSMPVTVLPAPAFDPLSDTLLCNGEELLLDASLPDATGYAWSDLSTDPSLLVQEPGTYSVTVTNGLCEAADTAAVRFFEQMFPMGSLQLGPNIEECAGFPVSLEASVDGIDNYYWTDGLLGNQRTITSSGTYGLVAEYQGCTLTDQVNVTLNECVGSLYVPNAFSPNDDGINDYFEAYGDHVSIQSLRVFDRWGGAVFLATEDAGTPLRWDGQRKGKPLQPGVYVYWIHYLDLLTGKVKLAKGEVSLLR